MELRKLVEMVLDRHPETRRDDRKLILAVWKCQGLSLTEAQIAYVTCYCTIPETIRRMRQKIQEEGHFWPEQKQGELCLTRYPIQ